KGDVIYGSKHFIKTVVIALEYESTPAFVFAHPSFHFIYRNHGNKTVVFCDCPDLTFFVTHAAVKRHGAGISFLYEIEQKFSYIKIFSHYFNRTTNQQSHSLNVFSN